VADGEADSPELEANLQTALREVRAGALRRDLPTLALVRRWHALTLQGLAVPKPAVVGRFRGEPGLESYNVVIGRHRGVEARQVRSQHGSAQVTRDIDLCGAHKRKRRNVVERDRF
jgi:hypothetical protein